MGGLLVGEGGADGEAGGDSACSSAKLQLVGALRRGKCSGAAVATGWEGRIDGARGRLGRIGLLRFDAYMLTLHMPSCERGHTAYALYQASLPESLTMLTACEFS